MIRAVLIVLMTLVLGGLVCWLASQTPGGKLAQAGVVGIGLTATAGLIEAVTKGNGE